MRRLTERWRWYHAGAMVKMISALLLSAVADSTTQAQAGGPVLRDSAGGHLDWYRNERVYPSGTFPVGAMQAALAKAQGQRGSPPVAAPSGGLSLTTPGWRSVGPTPIAPGQTYFAGRGPNSGRVNAIATSLLPLAVAPTTASVPPAGMLNVA